MSSFLPCLSMCCGPALKYQQLQGLLPKERRYDLFRGGARTRAKDEQEKGRHHVTHAAAALALVAVEMDGSVMVVVMVSSVPRKLSGQIKFGSKTHPECARFSPDGQVRGHHQHGGTS